jgi:hypothetical protein
MEPIAIGAFIAIVAVAGWLGYLCRRNAIQLKMRMSKSSSHESLNTMVNTDDPTPISS